MGNPCGETCLDLDGPEVLEASECLPDRCLGDVEGRGRRACVDPLATAKVTLDDRAEDVRQDRIRVARPLAWSPSSSVAVLLPFDIQCISKKLRVQCIHWFPSLGDKSPPIR